MDRMSRDSYLTLSTVTNSYLREKASKFHGFAYPVKSLEEIERRLKELSKEFYDAKHVCYAYRLGPMGEIWRANDAGEPAHSAGDPILNELKSKGVTDALCVVIRYFGGTKLGVGGLVKAYGWTAKAALEDNPVREVLVTRSLRLRFPYGKTSEVNRLLQKNGWESSESCFAEDCRISLMIPESQFELAKTLFYDLGVLDEEAEA